MDKIFGGRDFINTAKPNLAMNFTGIGTTGEFTSVVSTVPPNVSTVSSTKAAKRSGLSINVTDFSGIGLPINTANASFMSIEDADNDIFDENMMDTLSQNTTTSLQHTENEFLFWIVNWYFVITVFIVILGLLGSVCIIITMRREPFRSNTYGIHLTALAVVDMLNIISITLSKDSTIYFRGKDIIAESVIICKVFFYLMSTTRGVTSSTVAFISIERFIAVWFPFKAKQLLSKQNALIISGCVFGAANIVVIFILLSSDKNSICSLDISIGAVQVSIAIYITLYIFIPILILLLLTPLTIFELTRQQLLKRRLNSANRIENTTYINAMLIGTITAFLVLFCCPFVARVVIRLSGRTQTDSNNLQIRQIILITELINCSVNFFIYGLLCSDFRNQFINICKGLYKSEHQNK